MLALGALAATILSPSFPCERAVSETERLVCADAGLARLDRELATVYAKAVRKAGDSQSMLRAEQRGWLKGRDDCWKDDDRRACVQHQYRLRIAELQARHRLAQATGPVRFRCDGEPANGISMTFFQTDPPTALARRDGRTVVMFGQPAASGARSAGPNESFWEHQGEARVAWGYGAPELRCRVEK